MSAPGACREKTGQEMDERMDGDWMTKGRAKRCPCSSPPQGQRSGLAERRRSRGGWRGAGEGPGNSVEGDNVAIACTQWAAEMFGGGRGVCFGKLLLPWAVAATLVLPGSGSSWGGPGTVAWLRDRGAASMPSARETGIFGSLGVGWSSGSGKGHGQGRAVVRLRGGYVSNTERWESAGYDLRPDLGPLDHPEVSLDDKLGDAAEIGQAEQLKQLILAGANVNQADENGFTGLHRAAFNGQYECVSVLLEAGANPNAQDYHGGRTPLHQAAAQGYKQVCKKLLSCGADAKIKDKPESPNLDAVPGIREAIAEMPPISDDCGPDKVYHYPGLTALEYAQHEGYDSVAEMLQPWTNEY